ncbi:hypothetical protein [Spiroplasma culicicola]|uniref:Uncharacterized protein n=1 Tax=Spiroplasma culicicola AES-1 TaxID=1276246 RepID=W6AH75_9MOLU|nr:hypothetical protein [Spiroplasma culicicola]AHI53039.1 hypothetical protein SCULI_v1c06980 [Spiroplasma culicicola AES-1]
MKELIVCENIRSTYFDILEGEEKGERYRVIKFKNSVIKDVEGTYDKSFLRIMELGRFIKYFQKAPLEFMGEIEEYEIILLSISEHIDSMIDDETFIKNFIDSLDVIFENMRVNIGQILNYYVEIFSGKNLSYESYINDFSRIYILKKLIEKKGDKDPINLLTYNNSYCDFQSLNASAKILSNAEGNNMYTIREKLMNNLDNNSYVITTNVHRQSEGQNLSELISDIKILINEDNEILNLLLISAEYQEKKFKNKRIKLKIFDNELQIVPFSEIPKILFNTRDIFEWQFKTNFSNSDLISFDELTKNLFK